MKARTLGWLALLVALSLGGWWYASPYWVLYSIKKAAEKSDAETVSDHVDYPKLRESLKGEINAMLMGKLNETGSKHGDAGRAGAALGAMLGMALTEKIVEAMVRPEFVMKAIREGQFTPPGRSAQAGGAGKGESSGAGRATSPEGMGSLAWRHERSTFDRMVVYVAPRQAGGEQAAAQGREFGLVFERSGFSNWKLSAVRFPPMQP